MPKKSKSETKATPELQYNKVAERNLTNGELVFFAEINNAFSRIQTMMGKYLTEKYGYPETKQLAFQFDWQNKKVLIFERSSIEVAKDAPPAKSKTS